MFIYNFKINGNLVFKFILAFIVIIAFTILIISSLNLLKHTHSIAVNTAETNKKILINSTNYTNMLEEVYNNLDSYIGKEINFSGYVYRLSDMKNTEFVLARDMLINSDNQSVVVGFLCTSNNAKNLKNGTWVNVSGNIIKGYYHDQIPVIDIKEIEEIESPEDAFVYPPNMCNTST